ncbi:MAG: phosphoribosylanthranilate isomerase [Pseudomonadota bacterium]
MTRVKICGIRTLDAALAACDAGADALGFVFYPPSPRFVEPEAVEEIIAALPPLVTTVGLFVNPAKEAVAGVLERCPLDALQFHGTEEGRFCEAFARPYLRAVSMRPGVDIEAILSGHPRARAFLFDAYREGVPGGTGETFAWDRIPAMRRPWLLAGGLNPDNVAAAIRSVSPPGVDVSGGVENEPGVKDPVLMQRFIAAVRGAQA